MSEQITITIGETGDVSLQVAGCPGKGCQQLTEAIEKAIGQTTHDRKTTEYHRPARQGQQQQRTQS